MTKGHVVQVKVKLYR